jgi:hypothetical protein
VDKEFAHATKIMGTSWALEVGIVYFRMTMTLLTCIEDQETVNTMV